MRPRIVPCAIWTLAGVLAICLLALPSPHLRNLVFRASAIAHATGQSPAAAPPPATARTTAPDPPHRTIDRVREASWDNPCGLLRHPRPILHVIWIWSRLAANCGTTGHYLGLTHPSLPNYLAAASGSTHGIRKDCFCSVSGPSLMSQVTSWRLYAQSMPRNCDPTDDPPTRHTTTSRCISGRSTAPSTTSRSAG